jgi:hypothetical protein
MKGHRDVLLQVEGRETPDAFDEVCCLQATFAENILSRYEQDIAVL